MSDSQTWWPLLKAAIKEDLPSNENFTYLGLLIEEDRHKKDTDGGHLHFNLGTPMWAPKGSNNLSLVTPLAWRKAIGRKPSWGLFLVKIPKNPALKKIKVVVPVFIKGVFQGNTHHQIQVDAKTLTIMKIAKSQMEIYNEPPS